jgi:cytochrome c oxidase subunit III
MSDSLISSVLTPGNVRRGESSGGTGSGTGGVTFGRGGDGPGGMESIPQRVYVTGMTVAICGIVMFFAAIVSASIVRQGLGAADWRPLEIPRVLWLNTVILLASSFSLARAGRLQLAGDQAGFRHWWNVTLILGVLFLAGQVIAWRQLAAACLYMATSPTAGFFYVFTGAHGLHLAGGIVALIIAGSRRTRWMKRETVTRVAALYWHFLTGLWLFLLLFFVWERYS